jgi:hypothetical protein
LDFVTFSSCDFRSFMPAELPIMSVPRTSCRLQLRVLPAQARGFHRPADHHHQLVDVEGLLDEVVGALFDRRDRDLDIAMARDDHDRHIGVVELHMLEDVDPVHVAVLEPDIEDHQPRRGLVQLGHAFVGRACTSRRKAFIFKDIADQFADIPFVVHHQNIGHLQLSRVSAEAAAM